MMIPLGFIKKLFFTGSVILTCSSCHEENNPSELISLSVDVSGSNAGLVDMGVAIPLSSWEEGATAATTYCETAKQYGEWLSQLNALQAYQYETLSNLKRLDLIRHIEPKVALRIQRLFDESKTAVELPNKQKESFEPIYERYIAEKQNLTLRKELSKSHEKSIALFWLLQEIHRQITGSFFVHSPKFNSSSSSTQIRMESAIKGSADREGNISFALESEERHLIILWTVDEYFFRIVDPTFATEIKMDAMVSKFTEDAAFLKFTELQSEESPPSLVSKSDLRSVRSHLEKNRKKFSSIQALTRELNSVTDSIARNDERINELEIQKQQLVEKLDKIQSTIETLE